MRGCWASAADQSLPAASSRCQFPHFPSTKSAILCAFASEFLPDGTPGQQHIPDGSPPRRSGQQQLRHGAPASNKPHSAEKSTPVWLAIWRIWTGFANSQLRRATFSSTYLHICAHPHCSYVGLLLRQTQIFRPICTDCLRHLRISAR